MADLSCSFVRLSGLNRRFAELNRRDNIVLAVSGGSDSIALLHLVRRWKNALERQACPRLICVTVEHGLRSGSAQEARDVRGWSCALGIEHRTLKWSGEKPCLLYTSDAADD